MYGAKGLTGMLHIASSHGALMANWVGVSGTAYHHASLLQLENLIQTLKVCFKKVIMFASLFIYHVLVHTGVSYHGFAEASVSLQTKWPESP